MKSAEQKLAEFYNRGLEEIRSLSDEMQKAMKVLVSHEDYMGLHHLGYIFWEKKEE